VNGYLFLYLWLFSLITEPLKNELPKNFQTVADLVKINASLDSSVWSRHDVYERVKEIIVEQLSVDPKMVLPNSHLVDDLGMD
jgi:acyl carrier protein